MNRVGFAVVGVRNFAATHIKNIQKLEEDGENIRLTGVVVEDQLKNAEKVKELRSQGIKVFDSYDQLLHEGSKYVDVIVLPTSLHSHGEMAMKGMNSGYNVLLEKPPVPTIDEMDELIKVKNKTGKFCSIGFQFIYSRSIRKLKKYLIDNKLGDIREMACKGYWPRYKSYYNRNPWAGRTFWNSKVVLDGPMHNAFAHFLNNMLFLSSSSLNESGELKKVRAELYRAHTYIDSDDTSCLEAETMNGIKIYFYVTHVSKGFHNPYLEIVGTKGKAYWHFNEITKIELNNGEVIEFDNDGVDPWLEVLRVTAKTHTKEIEEPYSTPENSRSFVVAINGAYDSARTIKAIPEKYVKEFTTEEGEFKTVLNNVETYMDDAFDKRLLLSDLGVEWSHKTKTVNVENYTSFNPFKE